MTVQSNPMSTTDTPSISARRAALPHWPSLTFLSTMLAAILFAVAYVVNRTIAPPVLSLAATAGLGLVAGFAARYMLRGRLGLLRLLAAWAAILVGQLLLGLLTAGGMGVGPVRVPLTAPDWRGLWHCALSIWASLLALYAWPSQPTEEQPLAARRSFWQYPQDAWNALTERVRGALQSLRQRLAHVATSPNQSPVRARSGLQSAPAPRTRGQRNGSSKPQLDRKRRAKRMAEIHVMGTEESRCPYCLDIVQPNDARGIVVCPICRARHHADCWAITGMCQVPHHHAENHKAIH
jgi:ribosomal protein L37AE/L43A